jgi:hypothetical protein
LKAGPADEVSTPASGPDATVIVLSTMRKDVRPQLRCSVLDRMPDGTMSAQIKIFLGGCMQRTLLAVCAASVIGLTPLLAQSTRPSEQYDSKDTTITGCLQKNKSGGFWLTDASIDSAGAKASTTTADPTGTSGTSTTTSGDKDVRRATARGLWNLENGKDLDRYLNQRIQVTGRAKKDTSGDELKGTTGKEMDARDFDVKSVTKISDSCR